MDSLVLNPHTAQQINAVIARPTHAIALAGPAGSGKLSIATSLIEIILSLDPGKFELYAYGLVLRPPEGKAIGIEAVRELEHFLSLKVPTNTAYNRAVIIEDGHKLTVEAQNALLKVLEEPPAGTILLITVSHPQSLLPTIRSRLQIVNVQAPAIEDLQVFFTAKGIEPTRVQQAFTMTGGLPGLMQALLQNTDHPLLVATKFARELLGMSTFERVAMVDELAKQKQQALDVVFILQQMAHVSLLSATGKAADKWQHILETSYQTAEALAGNAQPKLTLTNLMLQL